MTKFFSINYLFKKKMLIKIKFKRLKLGDSYIWESVV